MIEYQCISKNQTAHSYNIKIIKTINMFSIKLTYSIYQWNIEINTYTLH